MILGNVEAGRCPLFFGAISLKTQGISSKNVNYSLRLVVLRAEIAPEALRAILRAFILFYEQTGVAYRETVSESTTSPTSGISELLEAV